MKRATPLTPNTEKKPMTAKFRLIKFGSKTCGACIAMSKAKTLDKFKERHPEVSVVNLDISDSEGESPALGEAGNADGIDYKKNYSISDDYEVTALPTLVFEVEGGGEIFRIEGAANLKQIEEMYDSALDYAKRSEAIPW